MDYYDFDYFIRRGLNDMERKRSSVFTIKRSFFKAIYEYKMQVPTNRPPTHLVLGRDEWAAYQGLVQCFAANKVNDSVCKPATFFGLTILQSAEESCVLTARQE
jgi:hypothetical protein